MGDHMQDTYPNTARLAELHGVELKPTLGAPTVARLLGVSRATVARWTREKRLAAFEVGGVLKIEAAELERFIVRRAP